MHGTVKPVRGRKVDGVATRCYDSAVAPPKKDPADRRDRPLRLRASIVEVWRTREAAIRAGAKAGYAPWAMDVLMREADRLRVPQSPTAEQLAAIALNPERRHNEPPAAEAAPVKPRRAAKKKAR